MNAPSWHGGDWAAVAGYEGLYEVSNDGKVRSLRIGRLLRPAPSSNGYLIVSLYRDGARKIRTVHSIVAEAFVPGRFEGAVVRHVDDDRHHNVASNLLWGTQADNEQDKVAHGRHPQKRKTHCPQGHPYDETNTIHRSRGGRECRTCRHDRRVAA